jgi:hypothetical protein
MARIIVLAEPADRLRQPAVADKQPVLLDERVDSVHLCDDHAAEQLIERLAWAVSDAEDVQAAVVAPPAR